MLTPLEAHPLNPIHKTKIRPHKAKYLVNGVFISICPPVPVWVGFVVAMM
jgi:hypothetical protein